MIEMLISPKCPLDLSTAESWRLAAKKFGIEFQKAFPMIRPRSRTQARRGKFVSISVVPRIET